MKTVIEPWLTIVPDYQAVHIPPLPGIRTLNREPPATPWLGDISTECKGFRCEDVNRPTPRMYFAFFEMMPYQERTFAELFASVDAEESIITIDQIRYLVEMEKSALRLDLGGTFALLENASKVYVGHIQVDGSTTMVTDIYPYNYEHRWRGGYDYRLIKVIKSHEESAEDTVPWQAL